MKSLHNINLPLIAILRGITPEEVLEHAQALIEEGFAVIEVPANSPNWQQSVSLLQKTIGDKAIIGAGTITQQALYGDLVQTNAKLLVTPNLDRELVTKAVSDNMLTCIGALTPSEILEAVNLGVDIVKVFPAGNMGVSYCKAILSILPESHPYYCVGGITPDNLADYLSLGFTGAGLGGDLYRAGQSVEQTRSNAALYVKAYQQFNS